jgi:hypothetical protein
VGHLQGDPWAVRGRSGLEGIDAVIADRLERMAKGGDFDHPHGPLPDPDPQLKDAPYTPLTNGTVNQAI